MLKKNMLSGYLRMECRKEKKAACFRYKHEADVPEEEKGQESTKGPIVFD